MSVSEDDSKTGGSKSQLREEGRAMRRKLVGNAYAEKLDREVYTNRHMEKFAEITQEVVFAQLWTRPGLDLKTRTLITIISDTTSGSTSALRLHIRFGRVHGWTEDELVEAIMHCLGYIGVPLVRQALIIATEVFDEMREES